MAAEPEDAISSALGYIPALRRTVERHVEHKEARENALWHLALQENWLLSGMMRIHQYGEPLTGDVDDIYMDRGNVEALLTESNELCRKLR